MRMQELEESEVYKRVVVEEVGEMLIKSSFLFDEPSTSENYTYEIVGSVRCV